MKAMARRLLEFPQELERNIYIDAIAGRYGIASEELKRMVNSFGASMSREQVEAADAIVGNVPTEMLAGASGLRLLQLNSAGYEQYAAPGVLPDGCALCCATGAYGQAVSEHLFAMVLSLVNVAPRVYRALALMRVMDFMPVSRADMRRSVRELDPSVFPEWRRTFRVAAGQMARVRGRVECLCEGLPLTADEVFDLTLAVGEALGNAVDHAGERGVLVTVAAYADRVVVDVADCGQGFSLGPDEELPEVATDAERGRGIKLMRMLADSASISPKSTGEGSVTHLVKLFSNSVVAR